MSTRIFDAAGLCVDLCRFMYIVFAGEVILWDTGREDEVQVATSGIGDDSHREPVSKVAWLPDPDSKGKKFHVGNFIIVSSPIIVVIGILG